MALLVLLLALGPACRRPVVAERPIPRTAPIPRRVAKARLRLRAHDTAGALALLEARRPLAPGEPERAWLLVHVLAGRQSGAAARRAIDDLPPGALRAALEASISEEPALALEQLDRKLGRPGSPWMLLASAYLHGVLGHEDMARRRAGAALGHGSRYVDVDAHLLRGRLLLEEGRLDEARRAAILAASLEPTDTRTHGLVAASARLAGKPVEAAEALLRAMARVPENEDYPRLLAELIRNEPRAGRGALAATVKAGLATSRPEDSAERLALDGLLAEETGDEATAVARYVTALARGALAVPVDRDLRRLHVGRGDYAAGLALLYAAIPPGVRTDALNLRARAWARLDAAGRSTPRSQGASPEARLELAQAFVGVGALPEARSVLEGVDLPAARDLDRRLAAHQAFEDALEATLEGGYRVGHRKGEPPSFERVLVEMSRLARRHLPPEEAQAFQPPYRGVRKVPVMGGWLDHHTSSASPAVLHFRRYGRFLMLGQRSGQPTEAILLSIASLHDGRVIRTRGQVHRHDVAIGYDRRLRSYLDARGAGLGGACLPDGIWLDADSAREADGILKRAVLRDPGRLHLAMEAQDRLLPPDGPGGVFGLTETAGVGIRLVARYAARRGDHPWGSFGTLTAHEHGHVVEIKRHLPFVRGLPASMLLLAESGFDPLELEMELERRAQLAALADAPDPDLALAEMVLALPVHDPAPEAHDGGYRDAVHDLMAQLWRRPDLYPTLDRAHRLLPQLDRLTNEQIRRAARAALRLR